MKKINLLVLWSCISVAKYGDFDIDEIKAIVEGPVQTDLILASDVKCRAFDGVEHSVEDLVVETIKDQRGKELGLTIDDEDVDKYLRGMSQGMDVSKEALTTMSENIGFENLKAFYDALKKLYRANATMDQEIRSYLAVSEQEAKAYYDEHPEYKPGVYYIQMAHIPFRDDMSKDELRQALEHPEKNPKLEQIDWGEVFDISYDELAEDKQFIKGLNVGECYVSEIPQGFDVYKLKNNRKPELIPFAERRKDIITQLREEKFGKAFERYNEEIKQLAIVTYL